MQALFFCLSPIDCIFYNIIQKLVLLTSFFGIFRNLKKPTESILLKFQVFIIA